MKRRLTAIVLAAALAFALCGCGSAFEKEYEAVSDYVPTVQASPYTGDKVTVRSFGSLKQAISEFVLRGETQDCFRHGLRRGRDRGFGQRLLADTHAERPLRILRGEYGL